MSKKKKVSKPDYSDLMVIVNNLEDIRDMALFMKYFILHLCFEYLKLKPEAFEYLVNAAIVAADKAKKGAINDNWRLN